MMMMIVYRQGIIQKVLYGVGSIAIELRFFDKSITHFVVLSRCVEGKVNLGFSIDIFDVAHTSSGTFYFEDINMNSRKIKSLGGLTGDRDAVNKKYLEDVALTLDGSNFMIGDLRMGQKKIVDLANPTGDGQATNKKCVDTQNAKQDIAIADKASKSYVDNEIAKIPKNVLLLDGSKTMTGNLRMDNSIIYGPSQIQMRGDISMNNNKIFSLPNPDGTQQPVTLGFGDNR